MTGALLDRSLTNTAGLLAVFAIFQSETCNPIFRQSSDRQILAALLYSYYIASLVVVGAGVLFEKHGNDIIRAL